MEYVSQCEYSAAIEKICIRVARYRKDCELISQGICHDFYSL